jgi:lipoyl-dependent peroxiredoxin
MGEGRCDGVARNVQHQVEFSEDRGRTMEPKTETGKGKVIYTAKTRTTGGREHGIARSSDGHLDVKLATPGLPWIGTNPEQLFAAAWSASFESAIALAARNSKVTLGELTIDAELDLRLAHNEDHSLSARLNISIAGVDRTVAMDLVRQADRFCPYSKAMRGNVDVTHNVGNEP